MIEFVFRQKHRSGPGTGVMALAMIITVCGVLIAIFATTFNDSKFIDNVEPMRKNKNLIISTLAVAGSITFITGIWGIASYKIENKIFVGIFGGLTAFVIVINGGIYAVFNSLTKLREEDMVTVCPEIESKVIDVIEPFLEVKGFVKDIDYAGHLSSFYMCSNVCPCPVVDTASWSEAQNWLKISEKDLNVLERTSVTDVPTALSPLVFFSKDEARAKYSQTFTTFSDCVDAIVAKTWVPNDPIGVSNIKDFALESLKKDEATEATTADDTPAEETVRKDSRQMIEAIRFGSYFDSTHGCAGFCHAPLFSFAGSITSGRPQTNCREAIRSEMQDTFQFASAVAIITMMAAIITFAGQYLLWKKYQPENGDNEATLEDTEGSVGDDGESKPLYSDGMGNPVYDDDADEDNYKGVDDSKKPNAAAGDFQKDEDDHHP